MVDLNSSYPLDGTDDIAPILSDPNAHWKIWALAEIWQGQEAARANGNKRYVPKLYDYVCDYELNKWYIVTKIDELTHIPH